MNQKAFRSKSVYFAWMLAFMATCLIAGVFLYIQTAQISLTSNLKITLEGADGEAHITSIENPLVEGSPDSGFYSSIEYHAYPSSHLSNGQQVVITAVSQVDLARQFRIMATSKSVQVTIEGLSSDNQVLTLDVEQ